MTGCPPPDFHLDQNLLNCGLLFTNGFGGTKGFFSGKGVTGDFFCGSEDSAMMMFLTDKRPYKYTE